MKKFFYLLFLTIFVVIPGSVFASDLTIMPIYTSNWGDAALLESGGEYLLLDLSAAKSTHTIDFLKNKGVKKFSLYLSHYHYDHYGRDNTLKIDDTSMSLFEYLILNSGKGGYDYMYTIENVYIPDVSSCSTNPGYCEGLPEKFKAAAEQANVNLIELKQGSKFKFGNTSAEVLYAKPDAKVENNTSLVTMFTNGKTKYLNGGDIEDGIEEILVNSNIDISADIFKLNHHGIARESSISNTQDFINKVKPKYAYFHDIKTHDESEYYVYSVIEESIKSLVNVSANIYDIQRNGNIMFKIEDDEITPIVEKGGHNVIIHYVDESTNNILKTRTFDFNYDIIGNQINHYLYDYEKTFEGYTLITDINEIPQTATLTEDKVYYLKYKKNSVENPKTGTFIKYGMLIIAILISSTLYLTIRKKSRFPKSN